MFVKTDSGYQDSKGKTVVSVDGHPDLDALFKRSISKEGYLVYYPVLLKKQNLMEPSGTSMCATSN